MRPWWSVGEAAGARAHRRLATPTPPLHPPAGKSSPNLPRSLCRHGFHTSAASTASSDEAVSGDELALSPLAWRRAQERGGRCRPNLRDEAAVREAAHRLVSARPVCRSAWQAEVAIDRAWRDPGPAVRPVMTSFRRRWSNCSRTCHAVLPASRADIRRCAEAVSAARRLRGRQRSMPAAVVRSKLRVSSLCSPTRSRNSTSIR